MKTILATAYGVNPYKGSEDGMGWNFICQIARFNKVIAITRENNKPEIEKFISENPDNIYDNILFLFFDLPYWMRFWKRGGNGAMLYFLLWQIGIVRFIKKQKLNFDLVHNLNFHNDWTPSYLWMLHKPFVWGPIGHHPLIPKQYLAKYDKKYWLKDRLTWIIKKLFWNFSFGLKMSVKKADKILCMNQSVKNILPINQDKMSIMPSVATQDFGFEQDKTHSKFRLVSAGRLVPLKGFDLTIKAFAKFANSLAYSEREKLELTIVGSGPELENLKNIAKNEGVYPQVKFIQWLDRKDLMDIFKNASSFIFPSHEGAGMVVAEALSFGLPVICLNNDGPGEFIDPSCGYSIDIQSYCNTVEKLSEAMKKLFSDAEKQISMKMAARKKFENFFHWDRRGEQLNIIYQNILS